MVVLIALLIKDSFFGVSRSDMVLSEKDGCGFGAQKAIA